MPAALGEQVPGQIVGVGSLLDDYLAARLLVVEASAEGLVKPAQIAAAFDVRIGLFGVDQVVAEDEVATAPGGAGADRGCDHVAARRIAELGFEVRVFGQTND